MLERVDPTLSWRSFGGDFTFARWHFRRVLEVVLDAANLLPDEVGADLVEHLGVELEWALSMPKPATRARHLHPNALIRVAVSQSRSLVDGHRETQRAAVRVVVKRSGHMANLDLGSVGMSSRHSKAPGRGCCLGLVVFGVDTEPASSASNAGADAVIFLHRHRPLVLLKPCRSVPGAFRGINRIRLVLRIRELTRPQRLTFRRRDKLKVCHVTPAGVHMLECSGPASPESPKR